MRQLKPDVVEDRKKKLLQWVIHRYIKTSSPVASQQIAEESGMELSSASIRNVLKELESEGYLEQPHTSSGRIPTDKGYRFYVDYLIDIQRLAAEEKERIERRYAARIEEMDQLLSETSKLLSAASHSAGLVLSPKMDKHSVKRLELIPIGGSQVLAVVVTQAGLVRHWPIKLGIVPTAAQINRLNRFLNDNIQSRSIKEIKQAVQMKLEQAERELRDLGELAKGLLDELSISDEPGQLFLEGAARILTQGDDLGDLKEIQSLMSMIEGKKVLAEFLEKDLEKRLKKEAEPADGKSIIQVRIGEENELEPLRNLSLVTTTYRFRNQVVGVLGILGSKRMEYSRMMGLVDHVSGIVSRTLEAWDEEEDE